MATNQGGTGGYKATPMPQGGGTTTNSPLGVPSGYKAPTITPQGLQTSILEFAPGQVPQGAVGSLGAPMRTTTYGTIPLSAGTVKPGDQYASGDQWSVPLSDPESIPGLQQQLIAAGLLNPKSVRLGTWDVTSANAYSTVLGFANAYGLNATQALQVLVSNPKAQNGPQAPTIAFTNPQDVETGFQNVSQNLTGQEMPTDQFVQHYHDLEAAQAHAPGSNYTQAPSVQGAATQYVLNNDPSQVQAYGTASRVQELYSMLGIRG